MIHFYGEKPADEKRAHFSGALRLARNDGTARFSGVIHENINAGGKSIGQAEAGRFIRILHYMIVASRHEAAYGGIEKAVALYPDYVDLHLYKGLLQYKQGEYEKARDMFRCCLLLGETNMEYLILSGSGSFLPLYYIGLCHEMRGQAEQAAEAFRQAETLCPGIGAAGLMVMPN